MVSTLLSFVHFKVAMSYYVTITSGQCFAAFVFLSAATTSFQPVLFARAMATSVEGRNVIQATSFVDQLKVSYLYHSISESFNI